MSNEAHFSSIFAWHGDCLISSSSFQCPYIGGKVTCRACGGDLDVVRRHTQVSFLTRCRKVLYVCIAMLGWNSGPDGSIVFTSFVGKL